MKKITNIKAFCDGLYVIEERSDGKGTVPKGSECKWITRIKNLDKAKIEQLRSGAYACDRDISYMDLYVYCSEARGTECRWQKVKTQFKEYTSRKYILRYFNVYSIEEKNIEKYIMIDSL